MKRNVQKLGTILEDRMKGTAKGATTVTAELGTINRNKSLSVDSVKKAIPKGSYMVNIALASSSYKTTSVSNHSHGLPSVFRGLKAGDRVLVVWCGFEPIVVAIVAKS